MSCWSATRAGGAGRAGWAGWEQLAVASVATARMTLLRILIEHLDHVVEVGLFDLRRPRFAGARDEDVVAGLREGGPIFLLALVVFHDHRHRRLVETGLGGRIDERTDADVRELAEQI